MGKHTWRLRGSLRTSSTGRVRVTDKPVVDTQYILRFAGSRTLKASATSVRTIRVKTVATTLVVRAAESVPAGDDVVLRGNVASAGVKRARATVIITRRPSAGGQSVTTRVLTNAQGDFTYVHHAATEAMVYAVSVAAKTPYRAAVARVTVTVTSDPGSTEPGSTDPGSTDPGSTDPGSTEPGSTEPGSTDPGSTDPGSTDPGSTDPGSTDPGTATP